ncbi:hypothetical protein [Sulfurisphaera ohwakuensis]|uniref:hypothetical protein n=1 Tax=Sulfurisphaera ohwakuensis TaxID=69656 RepID=UPI0036F35C7B
MPTIFVGDGIIKEGSCELMIKDEEIEMYIDIEYLISTVLPAFKRVIKNCSNLQDDCKDWFDSVKNYMSKNPKHVDAAILTSQDELKLIELSQEKDIEKLAIELNDKLQGTYLMLTDIHLIPNVRCVIYIPVVGNNTTASELQNRLIEALNNTSPLVKKGISDIIFSVNFRNLMLEWSLALRFNISNSIYMKIVTFLRYVEYM